MKDPHGSRGGKQVDTAKNSRSTAVMAGRLACLTGWPVRAAARRGGYKYLEAWQAVLGG
jgi:hypothetical protein